MELLSLYIEDDRYSVPTLAFELVQDRRRARTLAKRRLNESPHHLSVEARDGDALLFRIKRASCASPSRLNE